MPETSHRDPAPDSSINNESGLALLLAILAAMEAAQRNAILTLLDFLNSLPKENLALLAKTVQPHLTQAEIAALCGVSVRTVQRWDRLKEFWPCAADYWRDHRQRFYGDPDPAG